MSGPKCKVMGIVNVTPDSFSDGGKYFAPEEAVRRALNMIEDGADIIDLGGESTRPGATPISWQEEWSRLEPVLKSLTANHQPPITLSIDTYHPETARKALAMGAGMINCVYAEPALRMLGLLEAYPDAELAMPATAALAPSAANLLPRLYLDPMIGFGTTRDEDLKLLKSLPLLAQRARVMVGVSRKRIVQRITGEKLVGKNLGGNLGMAVWCAMNGASVVRVHDVRETVQALKVTAALTA